MINLILVERLADGSVNRIPPEEWLTLKAKAGANYTVIDDNTGAPPERMRLYREGDDLVVEIDREPVAELEEFYLEDTGATYTADGSINPAEVTGEGNLVTTESGLAETTASRWEYLAWPLPQTGAAGMSLWGIGGALLAGGGVAALLADSDSGGAAPDTSVVVSSVSTDSGLDITGTSAPGAEVEVFVDGVSYGTVTADADGNWVLANASLPAAGDHIVTAKSKGGPDSDGYDFNYDTSVAVSSVSTDSGLDITGTAAPGAEVEVFVDGVSYGTVTADADGNWILADAPLPADGDHIVTAKSNGGPDSDGYDFSYDTTAPELTGSPRDFSISSGPDIDVTEADKVTLSGNIDPATESDPTQVEVTYTITDSNGKTITATVTPAADGSFSVDDLDLTSLADGELTIEVVLTDPVGNYTTYTQTANIDSRPEIRGISLDSGESDTDNVTSDTSLDITGISTPGALVEVFRDGVSIGSATADANGDWTLSGYAWDAASDGDCSLTAKVAGFSASDPYDITLDATAPELTGTPRDFSLNSGLDIDVTEAANVTLSGNIDPTTESDPTQVKVTYTITDSNGKTVTATVTPAADGSFSADDLDLTTLADGTLSVKVVLTDPAGNSTTYTHTADMDTRPEIHDISLDSGQSDSDNITNDTSLDITGIALPGSTVEVFRDGASIGSTTTDVNGKWTLSGYSWDADDDGDYSLTAKADGGAASDIYDVTLDATPPQLTRGQEFQVNSEMSGDQTSSATGLVDGGYIVTWQSFGQDGDDNGVYAQIYNSDGIISGNEFQVNSQTADSQSEPTITSLNDGGFVIAWTSNGQDGSAEGVYAQAYNADGTTRGSEFLVNTDTVDSQHRPAITTLLNGNYVITWTSEGPLVAGQDGSGAGVFAQAFNADGTTNGSEFQVNTQTVNAQNDPTIAALDEGGFIITWVSNAQDGSGGGIFAQYYNADGTTLGAEFQVNTEISGQQNDPAAFGLTGGGCVVAWTSDGQDGDGSGIYAQVYNNDGTALNSEIQVNSETVGNQSQPAITALSDGSFVIAWTSDGQDGDGNGIFAQAFNADGSARGSEFQVNTEIAASQSEPAITLLNDGGYIITWTSVDQDGSGNGVFGRTYNADGTPRDFSLSSGFDINAAEAANVTLSGDIDLAIEGDPTEVDVAYTITDSSGNVINGTASPDAGGTFSVANLDLTALANGSLTVQVVLTDIAGNSTTYSNSAQLDTRAAILDIDIDSGRSILDNVTNDQSLDITGIATPGSTVEVYRDGNLISTVDPIVADAEGNWTLSGYAWDTDGDYILTARADGGLASDNYDFTWDTKEPLLIGGWETRVNVEIIGDQSYSGITSLSDGGYVVSWTSNGQDGDGGGIYAQVYEADGTVRTAEFLVNATTAGNQSDVSITALGDGGYVVSWTSDGQDGGGSGIYAKTYEADGTVRTAEFLVNTTTADNQSDAAVTALSNGGYVVSWTSANQDGTGSEGTGVFAQAYGADGTPVGAEFQVNVVTANDQSEPSVSGLENGGYVVIWTSDGQDGSGTGIYARVFENDGTERTAEFLVNTTTTDNQSDAAVVGLSDGGYVVSWTSANQDGGGTGIYAQAYESDGTLRGTEFQVNTTTADNQSEPSVTSLSDGGYVVSWTSANQDGGGSGVYAAIYNLDGSVRMAEFKVNSEETGDQGSPSIHGLADGGFVVTWQSAGQDTDGTGVYCQQYNADGTTRDFVLNSGLYLIEADEAINVVLSGRLYNIIEGDPTLLKIDYTYTDIDGNTLVGTTTPAADGTFISSGDDLTVLTMGSLVVDVVLTDVAGNTSTYTGTAELNLDVLITSITDDSGISASDRNTNDGSLDVSGIALAEALVKVYFDDDLVNEIGSVTADLFGNWTLSGALNHAGYGDGEYTLVATATKDFETSTSPDFDFVWDQTPPELLDGQEFQVNTTISNNQSDSVTASLADGGYVICWQSTDQDGDLEGIYAQAYNVNGTVRGAEFQVNGTSAGSQSEPSISALVDGGYVVSWISTGQDGSGSGVYARIYEADGTVRTGESLVNATTADNQSEPCITALEDGGYVIAWTSANQDGSGSGVYAQAYEADGSVRTSEFLVNTTTADNQSEPAIAALADGGYVVTWTSVDSGGTDNNIYAKAYHADGTVYIAEFRVNATIGDSQSAPAVTALADGGYVVSWTSANQDGDGNGIYVQTCEADGTVRTAEFLVNSVTAADQSDPVVTALENGGFVVAWTSADQDGDGNGIYARSFDAAGVETAAEFLVNTETVASQSEPSVTALENGGYLISWTSDGQDGSGSGIHAQTYYADGSTRDFSLDCGLVLDRIEANSVTLSGMLDTSIEIDPTDLQIFITVTSGVITFTAQAFVAADGTFSITSPKLAQLPAGPITLDVKLIDLAGNTTTYSLTTQYDNSPVITAISDDSGLYDFDNITNDTSLAITGVANPETLVRVYRDGSEIGSVTSDINGNWTLSGYAHDADGDYTLTAAHDGEAQGVGYDYTWDTTAPDLEIYSEVQVNTGTAADQAGSSITGLADGGYVVTWESLNQDGSGNGVYAEVRNQDGTVRTAEFLVNETTVDSQSEPVVTALADGGYIVAWTSANQDGASNGVYAKTYEADGTVRTAEFQVNATTADSQSEPSVTALADGGYVVTWTSVNQDGVGNGVYAQTYEADGTVRTSEFLVNATTADSQSEPSVTALADGGYVVTWTSANQDGDGNGVYAQTYEANGTVRTSEFLVNVTTANGQSSPVVIALEDGGYVVTWTSAGQDGSGNGIYAQVYEADGTVRTAEFLVNTTTANDQMLASITALEDGGYAICWQSNGQDESGYGTYAKIFESDGTVRTAEFLVNTEETNDQNLPSITSLADGDFIVTWQSTDQDGSGTGVYAQRYSADGTVRDFSLDSGFLIDFSEAGSVTLSGQLDIANEDYPALLEIGYTITDSGGTTINGTASPALDGSFSVTDLNLSVLNDGQLTVAVALTDIAGNTATYSQTARYDSRPVITGISDDTGRSASDNITNDISLVVTGMATAGSSVQVFSNGVPIGAAVTADVNGNWTCNYAHAGDGNYTLTASSDGGTASNGYDFTWDTTAPKLAADFDYQVNAVTAGDQADPSIAGLADGGYVITWTSANQDGSGNGIYAQVYNQNYNVRTAEFRVNAFTTGEQVSSVVTALADGGYVIAWDSQGQDGGGLGIYAQAYNADSTIRTAEFQVNNVTSLDQQDPAVTALLDGGYVIAWESRDQDGSLGGVYAEVYNANGTVRTAEFQVNNTTLNYQSYAGIAAIADGGYVFLWASKGQDNPGFTNYGIYTEIYNQDGTLRQVESRVNQVVTGDQIYPDITSLTDGGYVVSWRSANQDGSGQGIYARIYNANGTARAGEFRVNATTADQQINPAITGLEDGGFVVTWSSNNQDGSGYGTYAQVYNADGTVRAAEFQLNITTNGDQLWPDITSLEDGGFVATWQSANQDGSGKGIYHKQYNPDGTPREFSLDSAFLIDSTEAPAVTLSGQIDITNEDDPTVMEIRYTLTDGSGNTVTGTTSPLLDGSFSIADLDLTVLNDGQVTINLVFTDVAGNTRTSSSTAQLSIIATTPTIGLAIDTGSDGADNITSDATMNVTLPGDSASWEYSLDNGATWNVGTGTSFELADNTVYGIGDIQVRQTDNDGNLSRPASNGTVVETDMTAPILQSSTPADDDTGVMRYDDIELTFSDDVVLKTGNIVISDGTDTHTIDVAAHGGQLSVSGNAITIDPTGGLANKGSAYNIQIDNGAVENLAGDVYAGISDSTTLNFDTESAIDVVFDLTTGLSSDVGGQAFMGGTSYNIYIMVDSTLSTVSLNPGEIWTGGANLGADDKVILVGTGADITNQGASLTGYDGDVNGDRIEWMHAPGDWAARLFDDGLLGRQGDIAAVTVDLWTGTANSGFLVNTQNLNAHYLTSMPGSITMPI
jgi:hypothetical protein